MSINQLDEFAAAGEKNTNGLTLDSGFPRGVKPARQWFNWLFNTITKKTNEVIEVFGDHVDQNQLEHNNILALVAATVQMLNNYLPLAGGTLTGNLTVAGQTYLKALWVNSAVNNSNVSVSIESADNNVLFESNPVSGAGAFIFNKAMQLKDFLKIVDPYDETTITHYDAFYPYSSVVLDTTKQRFQFSKLVNFGSYFQGVNGYTHLPNGFIMQWGTVDFGSLPSEGSYDANFPISFPNACLNFSGTRKAVNPSASDGDGGVLLVDTTVNKATVSLQYFSDDHKGSLRGFTWLAIGY